MAPRRRGTWYVVRDAKGEIRHTADTKRAALRPYIGAVTRAEVKGRVGVNEAAYQLRKGQLWRYLHRHGWRCTREYRVTDASAPASPSTRPFPAVSPVPLTPTSP